MTIPYRAETQINIEESPGKFGKSKLNITEISEEAFARSDVDKSGQLNFDEFMHTDALFEALKRDEFNQLDANSNFQEIINKLASENVPDLIEKKE